jgi:hypothetical protein
MTKRKQPKKPSSPLGHIVFPQKGPVRQVIEPLPADKEELEKTIVDRFAGALSHFEERNLEKIEKGDPWPDFEGREGIARVGIEVVELVNVHHKKLRHLQRTYEHAILEALGEKVRMFDGLHITLNDGYQVPPYPKVSSNEGKEIVECFVQNLINSADEISGYGIRKFFDCKWRNEPGEPIIGISGSRVAPKETKFPARIGFFGTFPESVEKIRSLLADTVQHKIEKSYTAYADGRLILLVYEVGSISIDPENQEAIQRAQNVLEQSAHHFDEVWYIWPRAESDRGILYKVWPK